jgi:hypothetical protein
MAMEVIMTVRKIRVVAATQIGALTLAMTGGITRMGELFLVVAIGVVRD